MKCHNSLVDWDLAVDLDSDFSFERLDLKAPVPAQCLDRRRPGRWKSGNERISPSRGPCAEKVLANTHRGVVRLNFAADGEQWSDCACLRIDTGQFVSDITVELSLGRIKVNLERRRIHRPANRIPCDRYRGYVSCGLRSRIFEGDRRPVSAGSASLRSHDRNHVYSGSVRRVRDQHHPWSIHGFRVCDIDHIQSSHPIVFILSNDTETIRCALDEHELKKNSQVEMRS